MCSKADPNHQIGEVLFAPVDELGKMSSAATVCGICGFFPNEPIE
jgi:hypothetical protein